MEIEVYNEALDSPPIAILQWPEGEPAPAIGDVLTFANRPNERIRIPQKKVKPDSMTVVRREFILTPEDDSLSVTRVRLVVRAVGQYKDPPPPP